MSRGSIGLDERLNAYIVKSHGPEHPVLAKLRAFTGAMPNASMQIAPEQGVFLAFLVRLIGARRTLEVGTFTGYSALAVALALPAGGEVVALDLSEEWTAIARAHWREAGVPEKVSLRLGPAADSLAALEAEGQAGTFDLAFIDADKTGYDRYYESALRLVRPGGLVVFDNMLQDGDVADPMERSASTVAIRALNEKIASDRRVDAVLLSLGDGMTVARRVS